MPEKKGDFLDHETNILYECTISIRESQDDWKYPIMPEKEYLSLNDLPLQQSIMWHEILSRCHVAALVSLFRAIRWIDAIQYSLEHENFYSFAANLRGFIESCTDSFYTTKSVPLTIGKDFYAIKKIIQKNSIIMLTHRELEQRLIHFTHAEKHPKEQKNAPVNLKAKRVQEYLTSMSKEDQQLSSLYAFTCQIVHPALPSNQLVLFLEDDKMIVCGKSFEYEKELIKMVLEENYNCIKSMYMSLGINCLEILKLLNLFGIAELKINFSLEKHLEVHPSWMEIKTLCDQSKNRYEEALRSGKNKRKK